MHFQSRQTSCVHACMLLLLHTESSFDRQTDGLAVEELLWERREGETGRLKKGTGPFFLISTFFPFCAGISFERRMRSCVAGYNIYICAWFFLRII